MPDIGWRAVVIKKVRNRFILAGTAAASAVTILLVLAINVFNTVQIDRNLDNVLYEMSQEKSDGFASEKSGAPEVETAEETDTEKMGSSNGQGKKGHGKKGGRYSVQTQYAGHFYHIVVDADGNTSLIGSASLTEELEQLAANIIETGKSSGTFNDYRYLVQENSQVRDVFVLDCLTEHQQEERLLLISVVVGAGGILVFFVFVFLMSRRIIIPLKINMEKQKRFITDAGHELKTPLSVIGTNMDILSMDLGENEWVDSTIHQVKKLRKLVGNLISLARMDEDSTVMVLSPFDVSSAAMESAEPFCAIASQAGGQMLLDIQEGLTARGDEASVRQLFTILCDNAMKYSTGETPIRIRLFQDGKHICFETENSWKRDITPEKLDSVFDRFYRGDASRDRRSGKSGYGLGLSIAKGIAAKNQLQLQVMEKNQRLVFRVTFIRC